MNLPPELIDEIIRYLASDVLALRRCSLVAKSWTHPSRKWLFKEVRICRKTHQMWLDTISARNVELLRNVRDFTYVLDNTVRNGITPYRIDSLYRYLPSFRRLERLGLSSMFLGPEVPQQIGIFSPFQHTLSSLIISSCYITSTALVTLINYFPLLAHLNLQTLTHEVNGEPVPQLSRPLRGTLNIVCCKTRDLALFDNLSNPPPELDELVLYHVHMPIFYNCFIGARGGSTRRLKLSGSIEVQDPFPALAHCQGLRELEVSVLPAAYDEVSLIASITSTKLQRIIFPVRYGFESKNDPIFMRYYDTIDNGLCRLVERLRESGYKNRLDMAFRVWEVPDDERMGLEELLPKFRERGRVVLLWKRSEKVVYRSS